MLHFKAPFLKERKMEIKRSDVSKNLEVVKSDSNSNVIVINYYDEYGTSSIYVDKHVAEKLAETLKSFI